MSEVQLYKYVKLHSDIVLLHPKSGLRALVRDEVTGKVEEIPPQTHADFIVANTFKRGTFGTGTDALRRLERIEIAFREPLPGNWVQLLKEDWQMLLAAIKLIPLGDEPELMRQLGAFQFSVEDALDAIPTAKPIVVHDPLKQVG